MLYDEVFVFFMQLYEEGCSQPIRGREITQKTAAVSGEHSGRLTNVIASVQMYDEDDSEPTTGEWLMLENHLKIKSEWRRNKKSSVIHF